MMRLFVLTAILVLLAACSFNPLRQSTGAYVADDSQYCGTASQDSEVHYFANSSAFGDWLEYRSIGEFAPALANDGGIIVVEMGQRPTGGYNITLNRAKSKVDNGALILNMTWNAPRRDAAVSQALIAQCVAIRPPHGRNKSSYNRIEVVDQLGNIRGRTKVN